MERRISTRRYGLAFVLTVIIFTIGMFVGMFFEDLRLDSSKQMIIEEKGNLQSLQLQQKYIGSGIADCTALNKILESNLRDLTTKMGKVIGYKNSAVFNEEELELQLQDYFLTEIQFLLVAEEIDEKCSQDSVKIVFFYDENEYDTQGQILDYIKKLFKDKVLIFSFDSNFKQEPMIDILLTSYKITQFPSLVIDGEVFHGHTPTREVIHAVCSRLVGFNQPAPELCGKVAE